MSKKFDIKTPAKEASENVVGLSHLLHILATLLTNKSVEANSVDPDQNCSYRSSLIWIYTVCPWALLKQFSRRQSQTTFVEIGALRFKL